MRQPRIAEEAGSSGATGAAAAEQAGASGTAAVQQALPGADAEGATAGGADTLSTALRREALSEGAAPAAAGGAEQAGGRSAAEQQAGLGDGSAPPGEGRAEQAGGCRDEGRAAAAASGLPSPAAAKAQSTPHGLQVGNMCRSCMLWSGSEITVQQMKHSLVRSMYVSHLSASVRPACSYCNTRVQTGWHQQHHADDWTDKVSLSAAAKLKNDVLFCSMPACGHG